MKLIKTSFYSGIIAVVRMISGFVSAKVVAMYVGPIGVALLGQFSNFISIVLTFSNIGISTGVIKYTAEYDDEPIKSQSLLSTSLRIIIFCSFWVSVLLLIFASFFSKIVFTSTEYANVIRVFGLGVFLYSLNNFLISVLNGKRQIRKFTIINLIGSLISLLFTVVLVYYFKLKGALYALAISQSAVCFVTLYLVRKIDWVNKDSLFSKFDFRIAKNLGKYSLMAIVSAFTVPGSQIIIRNMISRNFDLNAAGHWQGLMRISDAYLLVATTALSTYYLPQLSALKSTGELRKEILRGYKIILPVIASTSFLVYILRFFAIKVLYSSEFLPMADLFFFQVLGDFFKISSWILAYLMLAKTMTRVYIYSEIIFSITYIYLTTVFINLFGIEGPVIAYCINYFLYLIFVLFLFRKILLPQRYL